MNGLLRRLGPVVALCLLVLVAGASPASAHSAANTPASNYVSAITAGPPAGSGFTVRVIEAGSRLELRWRTGDEVLVPDYDGHPYLRIGPNGVDENQESNAVYLNRSRLGSTTIPDGLNPEGPPRWKRVSADPVARWHDHRIHWMAASLPPQVAGRTGERTLVQRWEVPITQGAKAITVRGELLWVPGPSPVGLLALAAVLALAVSGAALWAGRSAARRRAIRPAIAIGMAALVAADMVHLIGIAFGISGASGAAIGRIFTVGYVSVASWLLAGFAIVLLLRGREDAPYLVTFAAALMAIVGGLADFTVLSRTSVPFAYSIGVARLCVAVTLGLGAGLAIAGILLTRPMERGAPRTISPD